MTKDEFIDKHIAELVGSLLNCFAVERESAGVTTSRLISDEENAKVGRHFIAQQRAAKHLLGRLYDSATSKTPEK